MVSHLKRLRTRLRVSYLAFCRFSREAARPVLFARALFPSLLFIALPLSYLSKIIREARAFVDVATASPPSTLSTVGTRSLDEWLAFSALRPVTFSEISWSRSTSADSGGTNL